ncbi:hypothetical protein Ppb6_01230 [Photorhabdus australis subsp. thailandensis]|uniref:Uncharacterized protein n=1 Tax=Photorhabdus australis subsp. thailandensis TaxID=2805096 RepID=A0A1C0U6P9_9GAMM|nr:hypothetical protein [Photorhabdus australis]OCQ53604.1 hypothetical protein Ppb6_01230 [Photorhabdus australis subsp. thailandensis]
MNTHQHQENNKETEFYKKIGYSDKEIIEHREIEYKRSIQGLDMNMPISSIEFNGDFT